MSVKIVVLALTMGIFTVTYAQSQFAGKPGGPMTKTNAPFIAVEYPRLTGLAGFSSQLITTHIKLYQGYVANTNSLSVKLVALLADGKERTPEYAEMKRRFGWEFDGMRLHELYFGNLGAAGTMIRAAPIFKKIDDNFGSFEGWKKDFNATGAMRGIGWVILYQDGVSGRLFNAWIDEHDGGHLAGARPLIVLDVFEHAYMADFQLDRAKYIEVFFAALDWEIIEKRLIE